MLGLACLWVLWTNAYGKTGWRAYGEYETLSACDLARAKAHLMLTENILAESEARQKKGFFERLLSSRIYNPSGDFKCMPTGVAP